jgi:hypothetical protein
MSTKPLLRATIYACGSDESDESNEFNSLHRYICDSWPPNHLDPLSTLETEVAYSTNPQELIDGGHYDLIIAVCRKLSDLKHLFQSEEWTNLGKDIKYYNIVSVLAPSPGTSFEDALDCSEEEFDFRVLRGNPKESKHILRLKLQESQESLEGPDSSEEVDKEDKDTMHCQSTLARLLLDIQYALTH